MMEPTTDLAARIEAETGENVFACYQCAKCASGCPLAAHFDLSPNQVMRAAQLGQEDMALAAKTPWLCAGCQTCTTRCPNGIDVARVMDFMTAEVQARGLPAGVPEVAVFVKAFLRHVGLLGRAWEAGLIAEMNLRTGHPLKDLGMGLEMIRKGKIRLLPEFARPLARQRPLGAAPAEGTLRVGYYPGCSQHSLGAEYDRTVRRTALEVGIDLVEPEGWVCCGSSPAHRVDPALAARLPQTNLALFERMGLDQVTTPCSACFGRLRTAPPAEGARPMAVRSILDVLTERLDTIAARTTRPLAGLKVACYYGCLLTRPPAVTGAASPEYPMIMDRLVAALGAIPVDWNGKTTCCGASLSVTQTDIALDLSGRLLAQARAAGADTVAVACPLCHTNLDDRQPDMGLAQPMPIFYLTQLMALAFGLGDGAAELAKNRVDPRPLLAGLGLG